MNAAYSLTDIASSIRVAVVKDNVHFRESLEFMLSNSDGFQCVGAFRNAELALERIPIVKPDVILMDLHLPQMTGTECIRRLNAVLPATPIVVLTVEESPSEVFRALEAGAVGYLVKHESFGKVLEAVRDVHHGGVPMSPSIARLVIRAFREPQASKNNEHSLTEREKTILDAIVRGLHRKEIAEKLGISDRTVGSHLRHIYKKLHVSSLAHAILKYLGHQPEQRASP